MWICPQEPTSQFLFLDPLRWYPQTCLISVGHPSSTSLSLWQGEPWGLQTPTTATKTWEHRFVSLRAVSPSQELSSSLCREGDHHPLTSTRFRDDGGPGSCFTPRAPQGPIDPKLSEDTSMFSCCAPHRLGVPRRMGEQIPFQPC